MFEKIEKLIIPANSRFEERSIVVDGDVIVGSGCKLGYGIMARKIIVGERTTVEGDLIGQEIRLDSWSNIGGNVVSHGDSYIGEFTTIGGRLTVLGDLEIGRNVKIKRGFEAKGLITIQDPLPVIIFVFLYILELLRLGRIDEAEKLFENLEELESPLWIPDNSVLNLETIETDGDFEAVGSKILGNIKVKNFRAEGCEIFGSIRGKDIVVDGCRVHGVIEGRTIYLINGTEVFGSVKGNRIYLEEKCTVESSIIGKSGVWIKDHIKLPVEIEEELGRKEVEEKEELEVTEVDSSGPERSTKEEITAIAEVSDDSSEYVSDEEVGEVEGKEVEELKESEITVSAGLVDENVATSDTTDTAEVDLITSDSITSDAEKEPQPVTDVRVKKTEDEPKPELEQEIQKVQQVKQSLEMAEKPQATKPVKSKPKKRKKESGKKSKSTSKQSKRKK